MKITISKAAGEEIPNTIISITNQLPQENNENVFEREAEELFTALKNCLPGGTFDRLTVYMLKLVLGIG